MREILFRGKTRHWKWVYGWFCGKTLNHTMDGTEECSQIIHSDTLYWHVVEPETVGQFTGLTDKNGTKIFEGDIVAQTWYDHDEPTDDSFGEVVFCEYDCSFSVMDVEKDGIVPLGRCHAYHWEAEVIGNIHDNPELLEVSDGN